MTAVTDRPAQRPAYSGPEWSSPEEEAEWRASLGRRRRRMVLTVVAVVAAIGFIAAVLATTSLVTGWWTWQAPIQVNGGRVMYDGQVETGIFPVTDDDGNDAYRVTYEDGRNLSIEVSFSSAEPATITDVQFPANGLLAEQDVMFSDLDDGIDLVYEPMRPFDPSVFVNNAPMPTVRGRFEFAGCGTPGVGDRTVVDHVRVTYEARNRTRHLDVPITPIVIAVPAGACG